MYIYEFNQYYDANQKTELMFHNVLGVLLLQHRRRVKGFLFSDTASYKILLGSSITTLCMIFTREGDKFISI